MPGSCPDVASPVEVGGVWRRAGGSGPPALFCKGGGGNGDARKLLRIFWLYFCVCVLACGRPHYGCGNQTTIWASWVSPSYVRAGLCLYPVSYLAFTCPFFEGRGAGSHAAQTDIQKSTIFLPLLGLHTAQLLEVLNLISHTRIYSFYTEANVELPDHRRTPYEAFLTLLVH